MKRLILFFIRRKLGIKKHQKFRFTNQRSKNDYYYFSHDCLMKRHFDSDGIGVLKESNVKLNWILDDDCRVKVIRR